MAEEKNVAAEMEELFQDLFSDESAEAADTYIDENNDIFDLLGMSEEEKQNASKALADEDARYASSVSQESGEEATVSSDTDTASEKDMVSEEERLNSMLDDIFSDVPDAEDAAEPELITTNGMEAATEAIDETDVFPENSKITEPELTEETSESPSFNDISEEAEPEEDLSTPHLDNTMEEDVIQESPLSERAMRKQQKQAKLEAKRLKKEAASKNSKSFKSNTEKTNLGSRFSDILFGEEEDGPTPEEIAALEAKKAKKEQKKLEKEQKKAEKAEQKSAKKQQAKEMAVVKKAAAKDRKEQIRQEEEAEDAKEKRITPRAVAAVVIILSLLAATVILGTNQFNYHMVITRASNYFEMQKYKKAYEQIVGVDVKDRDQKIKDKIYCVMYVQGQLDSYHNFSQLNMHEKALDALVKGTQKYNNHIEEAKQLGIESDLTGLKGEIDQELKVRYNLTSDTIAQWLTLEPNAYAQQLHNYVSSYNFSNEAAKAD